MGRHGFSTIVSIGPLFIDAKSLYAIFKNRIKGIAPCRHGSARNDKFGFASSKNVHGLTACCIFPEVIKSYPHAPQAFRCCEISLFYYFDVGLLLRPDFNGSIEVIV